MEPVFSDWLTGTLSDEGWGPRDVQFASHYFLYFPIFHLKYSYIFPIFCPSEFLYSYSFVKKVAGRPGSVQHTDDRSNVNDVMSTVWQWRGVETSRGFLRSLSGGERCTSRVCHVDFFLLCFTNVLCVFDACTHRSPDRCWHQPSLLSSLPCGAGSN